MQQNERAVGALCSQMCLLKFLALDYQPRISVVGECAGIWPHKKVGHALAAMQGHKSSLVLFGLQNRIFDP
jgi:hypothetical protein